MSSSTHGTGSDRAVSTAVGYVLTLGITTLLVTGLLIAAGGAVDDQRAATTRDTLDVVGQRLAANLMTADRLTETEGVREVAVATPLPDRVAGSGYEIRIDDANASLVLESDRDGVTRRVSYVSSTPVERTTVRGGDLRIVLAGGELEVRST